jgi:hypothetical protein
MKFFLFVTIFVSQFSFAQDSFNIQRDLPLILKAQEALKTSGCEMKLNIEKDNIFIKLRSEKKSDASNFHPVITARDEIVKNDRSIITFTTTWIQHVLFSHKKFVTKLIITEENDRVSSVKMKTRESGATIYYPVLRYSSVKCMID